MSALSCACGWSGQLPPNCTHCPYCGRDSSAADATRHDPAAEDAARAAEADALGRAKEEWDKRRGGRVVSGAFLAGWRGVDLAPRAIGVDYIAGRRARRAYERRRAEGGAP